MNALFLCDDGPDGGSVRHYRAMNLGHVYLSVRPFGNWHIATVTAYPIGDKIYSAICGYAPTEAAAVTQAICNAARAADRRDV